MKRALVYSKERRFYAHAESATTAGVWIFAEPCIVLDGSTSDEVLGDAVINVASLSKEGVQHPLRWNGLIDPLLSLSGAKSWREFQKNSLLVEIELRNELIVMTPTVNLGSKAGFEEIPNEAVSLNHTSCQNVGRNLRMVFASSFISGSTRTR
jgi:hypothetical protein